MGRACGREGRGQSRRPPVWARRRRLLLRRVECGVSMMWAVRECTREGTETTVRGGRSAAREFRITRVLFIGIGPVVHAIS